jgi:prepilin-type N-terminal cleavage/methylation domain-containing protein
MSCLLARALRRSGGNSAGPSHGRTRRETAAFTLIELLLAIILLGVLLTLTYGAMFQITGNAQILTQEFSEDQEMRLLVRMIAQDIQAIRYLREFARDKGGTATFASGLIARTEFVARGDFSRISFHAAMPARQHRQRPESGDPLLHEVGYQVQEDRAAGSLVLVRREDYYLNDDLENGGVTSVLARDVEEFKVECLLPPQAPGQTLEVWSTDWDSGKQAPDARLPRAMRVTLGQLGKNGRHLKETLEVNLEAVLRIAP